MEGKTSGNKFTHSSVIHIIQHILLELWTRWTSCCSWRPGTRSSPCPRDSRPCASCTRTRPWPWSIENSREKLSRFEGKNVDRRWWPIYRREEFRNCRWPRNPGEAREVLAWSRLACSRTRRCCNSSAVKLSVWQLSSVTNVTKDVLDSSSRRSSRGNGGRRCQSGTEPRVRDRVWHSRR